jgi:alanyl-tRNA synthetase
MTFVSSAGLAQIKISIEHSAEQHRERYVLVQSCFHHFDLEKVGQNPVHLSLFEMGGAFAFGKVT